MTKTKVLLVGESWVSSATHYKGFDQFGSVTFHLGATPLVDALKDSEFELDYMPAHEAVEKLPFTMEGLSQYKAIILSDIGANSLLLGANEVVARERDDVEVLARLPEDEGNHPLLVTGRYGEGRTLVWTSDIGPHWLPNSFVEWPGYARLWTNVLRWISKAV